MTDATYSISQLHGLTKLDRRTITKRLERLNPEVAPTSLRYRLADALPLLCRPEPGSETDRDRRTRLQADLLQKDIEEREQLWVKKEWVGALWSEMGGLIRRCIEHAHNIPEPDRHKLLADIHGHLTEKTFEDYQETES